MIKSIYAKVATSGTIKNPVYELVKIMLDQPMANGWFTVQSHCGTCWLCHRDDMRQLFPIVGV